MKEEMINKFLEAYWMEDNVLSAATAKHLDLIRESIAGNELAESILQEYLASGPHNEDTPETEEYAIANILLASGMLAGEYPEISADPKEWYEVLKAKFDEEIAAVD